MSQQESSHFAIDAQAYYPGQAYNTPAMLQLAMSINANQGRLLDVGCGDGQLLKLLFERFPDIEMAGLTVSEDERQVCGEHFDVRVGDMHSLPWQDATFDAVISRHSLEHSISPLTALFEVNRVLRLDGIFHVVVPAPVSEWVIKWKDHFSVLPRLMWEKLFDDAGFVVEQYEEGAWLASFSMRPEAEMRFILRKVRDVRAGRASSMQAEPMPMPTVPVSSMSMISTLVECRIVVVLHNLVLFDAIRPVVERFRQDVKFLVPITGDSGFDAMGERTCEGIIAAGFKAERTALPADVRCDIELSPYPYSIRNVTQAKWRVRFMYGLAKEAWNFSLTNNAYYDFVLAYGDYDARVLSAYSTPVRVGNPKIEPVQRRTVSNERPVLLYLPTYGPTSSIEAVSRIQSQLKASFRVIAKAHHGTTYLEPERTALLQAWVDELAHHDTNLSSLLASADVVLSDGSGAIFDAIAAEVPVAVFQETVFGGLGGTVSLEERLVRDGLISATNVAGDIPAALEQALKAGSQPLAELRRELFTALGEEAAERAAAFLSELLTGAATYETFAAARRALQEKIADGGVQYQARQAAERQLDAAYRSLTDRLLADVQESLARVTERDGLIAQLNQAVHERDGRIAILNKAVAERDELLTSLNNEVSQSVKLNQAVHERDRQIAILNKTAAKRDELFTSLNNTISESAKHLVLLNQERDVYIDNIRSMRQTLSWRITAPMRLCKRVYRYGLVADDRNKLVRQLRRVYDRLPTVLRVLAKSAYRRLRGSSASGLLGVTATPLEAICTDIVLPGRQQAGLPDYFIWSVIDWHFRHQRPQQIALALANTGRRVFYISQIFIDHAEPGFTVEKLSGHTEIYQIRLHVRGAPIIYDAVPSAAAEQQIKSGIGQLLAWADCGSAVSVVNHPYWYGIACALPDSRLVYDCMDHHDGFGNNAQELSELEQLLFARSELVITTSTWLNDQVVRKGARTALVRNACDFEHFCRAPAEIYRDAAGRRIIGYYGAIAEWFDIDLLAAVARAFPEELVLLVGADTIGAARQLKGIPNIEFVGEVPYARLPYYLHAFDVCLLPFKVIPLTLATNPVKAYEYLAAGKPLVTVDLPEMSQFDGLVSVAKTEDDFIAAVQQELQMSATGEAAKGRAEFAAQQTWVHRTAEIIEQVEGCTPAPKVSVVVVTYNNLELTKACLHSLDEYSQYSNLEIIVVDNRSADGSPEWLQDWVLQGGNRRLVLNDTNKGFAAANNQGLHLATGDYLVMLNNDTYVTPGWVRTMVNHMRSNSRLGLLGPVTNNIGNEARIPIAYQTMEEMIQVSRQYVRSHIGQLYPLRTAAFFCVMLRAEVFALVGDLDEAFGRGFFEDDDYCRRIERAGFEIACADDVFIHHQLSASFSKLRGLERERLFDENRRIYEAKWGAWAPHSYRSGKAPISSAGSQPAGEFLEGHCVVCGNSTRFHYMNRMLWRESLTCGHCLTTSRYRSVARGILQALQGLRGIQSASLQALPRSGIEGVRVYDTQPPFYYQTCAYPLPDLLRQTGWIDVSLSQYRPDLPPGALIGPGITNQNLEALTFADASFDIVITSDVMEHVRLDAHAHREIHRVLKPGGVYLFTVPHDRSMPNTLVRVQVDPEDMTKDVHLLEPEYHGDTNSQTGEGVLSYRVYGRDLEVLLDELGFEVSYTRDDMPGEGIMSTELFCCRKREA